MVKNLLLTGANKGLGYAILTATLQTTQDVHVYATARNLDKTPCQNNEKLTWVQVDLTNPKSIQDAQNAIPKTLHAICNNAGIGFGLGFKDTLNTNFWGTKRICDAFLPRLVQGGRVCNIASASGPNYVSRLGNQEEKHLLLDSNVDIDALENLAHKYEKITDYDNAAYGLSKALVNAYTRYLARSHPNLVINSCTPGYLLTDMTRGMGATKPPSEGVKAPLLLLFGEVGDARGWYFGSDGLRSPLDRYRAPGDPPYVED